MQDFKLIRPGDTAWEPHPQMPGIQVAYLLSHRKDKAGLTCALVHLPAGSQAQRHRHEHSDDILYVIRGNASMWIDDLGDLPNNLSVRRAVEGLKVAGDFDQVRRVLVGAFKNNDFDAFELQVESLPGDLVAPGEASHHFLWSKFPHGAPIYQPSWKLVLDLVTTWNQRRGSLLIYRIYSPRDLELDVSLLTSEFPTVLADALDRALTVGASGPGQETRASGGRAI